MIQIKNLSKVYPNGTKALEDISLEINDQDIFGIIGLSGAGKSTLVRCINLLEKPTSGEILIDGKNLSSLNKKDLLRMRKNIGMVFQDYNLLEQRNVYRNVKLPLELDKVDKETSDKRVKELLALVGLIDKEKAYPSELSGGERQRVTIARALANNPHYLLCDEATSALDPDTSDSILRLLRKINQELKVTIIIISHDMSVIRAISNRIAVLDKSHIVEVGDVEEVFKHPQSRIAKRFIEYKRLEEN